MVEIAQKGSTQTGKGKCTEPKSMQNIQIAGASGQKPKNPTEECCAQASVLSVPITDVEIDMGCNPVDAEDKGQPTADCG